jgi:hypothetical protein
MLSPKEQTKKLFELIFPERDFENCEDMPYSNEEDDTIEQDWLDSVNNLID